jgi:serine/threonine-protein kinase RsbW
MEREITSTTTHMQLSMLAEPDYLSVGRAAVRRVGAGVGLDEEQCESVALAVVEALTNVIRHSYDGPCEKLIIVKLSKVLYSDESSGLEIVVRDFGRQVAPSVIKGRDLEDVRPGGLGVHIIHSVMDEVEFSPAQDSGMQLRMVKYINSTN